MASLSGVFNVQQFTDNGAPAASHRLYTYAQGTTTHKTAFTDAAGAVAHTYTSDGIGGQFIALNARGELPSPLFLASGAYDLCLKTSAGATVWTRYADGVDALAQSLTADLASTTDAAKGPGLVGFSYTPNYAVGTLGGVVKTFGIDPTQLPFNADKTGTNDCSAALAAVWAAFPGVPIQFPAGSFKLTAKTEFFSANNVSIFGPSARIRGAGIGVTFIENAVLNDVMWDFNADTLSPIELSIGLHISDLTIRKSGAIGTNSAIRIGNGYHADLSQLHIYGGYIGIELVNGTTADDGWNMVTIRNSRIENCTKWGIKADGSSGRNEGSFTTLSQVVIQACGTAPTTYAIPGISKAAAAVVSAAGHPFVNGSDVYIKGVVGMVEVSGRYVAAGVVAGVSFTLKDLDGNDINSTGFTAYAFGGTCELIPTEPSSGGVIYKGQILKLDQCAWTLNQNAALFIKGQAGLTVGVYANGCTWENNNHRHILCTGISNFQGVQNQFHANSSFPHHTGVEFRGDFTIRDVNWQGVVWRNNDTAVRAIAFRLSGSGVDFDTCRIDPRFVTWDNYDLWIGQTRFLGWQWDHIAQDCDLVVSSATQLVLRPPALRKSSATMPLRLRGGAGGVPSTSGEWAPTQIPSGGRGISNAGTAASTRYYCYLYDNSGIPALSLSTTDWSVDSATGYRVKSDDATRLFVGGVQTTAVANGTGYEFDVATSGWLNPTPLAGPQPGTYIWTWYSGTSGAFRRTLAILPTSDIDGALV